MNYQEITEANTLLSNFMGLNYMRNFYSWEYLFEVVEKLESEEDFFSFEFVMNKAGCTIWEYYNNFQFTTQGDRLDALYICVIESVKYFNEHQL